MRVPLAEHPRAEERGAIALLSAVLGLSLIVFAAFAIDFGMAYTSKRQLQTAADAAALAAGSYYADQPGTCAQMQANATYLTAARTIATTYVQRNRANATLSYFNMDCNGKMQPRVQVTASGSTPIGLGKLVFGGDSIGSTRDAEATVDVPTSVRGLRPYMLCSAWVPAPDAAFPSGVKKVDFPTDDASSGSCPHAAGNWFTLDCPHVGNSNNGNPSLATATETGCDPAHPVSVVDPQTTTSPAALYASLLAACPATSTFTDYDPDCLSSNPGNLSANQVITAWQSLVDKHQPIVFPVFCGQPTCQPAAWSPGAAGNNTLYPVHRLATAQVCGFHWGNKNSLPYVSTGATDLCNGTPDASIGTNSDNYLLLAFTHVQVSGSLDESDCAPGDPSGCDTGQREVRLTK